MMGRDPAPLNVLNPPALSATKMQSRSKEFYMKRLFFATTVMSLHNSTKEKKMNTFQKTMFTVVVMLAMTAVRVGAEPPFHFTLLPSDNICLEPVDEGDTDLGSLCGDFLAFNQGDASLSSLSRKDLLKKVTE